MLVDDSISVTGLATSAGSIALQDNKPADDAALVAKLKAAGAVILGDTNVTELGGVIDANMPQGYSSLGGQVLLPSDTNKNVGGSSGGSAAAVSAGFAPLAVGHGDRHRRGAADRPGGQLRRRGAQADRRPRQPRRRAAGGDVAGRARPDRRRPCSTRPPR